MWGKGAGDAVVRFLLSQFIGRDNEPTQSWKAAGGDDHVGERGGGISLKKNEERATGLTNIPVKKKRNAGIVSSITEEKIHDANSGEGVCCGGIAGARRLSRKRGGAEGLTTNTAPTWRQREGFLRRA